MTITDISLLERTATVRGQLDETGRVLDLIAARLREIRVEESAVAVVEAPLETIEGVDDDGVEEIYDDNVVELAFTNEDCSHDDDGDAPPTDESAPLLRLADVVSPLPLKALDDGELSDEDRDFEQRFNEFADGDTDDASRRWLTG